MPSRVVRMKPEGSFGPGWMNLAMMPATKPMMMVQRMLMGCSCAQRITRWRAQSSKAGRCRFDVPGSGQGLSVNALADGMNSDHRLGALLAMCGTRAVLRRHGKTANIGPESL